PRRRRLANRRNPWSSQLDPGHIEFASFRHLAQTAELGKFDYFFLAEGLRPRERLHRRGLPPRRLADGVSGAAQSS
ncbi:hypothetical protein ACFWIQ_38110, partial [Kitasatospora sp. NPDC127059]